MPSYRAFYSSFYGQQIRPLFYRDIVLVKPKSGVVRERKAAGMEQEQIWNQIEDLTTAQQTNRTHNKGKDGATGRLEKETAGWW